MYRKSIKEPIKFNWTTTKQRKIKEISHLMWICVWIDVDAKAEHEFEREKCARGKNATSKNEFSNLKWPAYGFFLFTRLQGAFPLIHKYHAEFITVNISRKEKEWKICLEKFLYYNFFLLKEIDFVLVFIPGKYIQLFYCITYLCKHGVGRRNLNTYIRVCNCHF